MNKKVLYPLLVLAVGFGIAAFIALNEPVIEPVLQEPTTRTVRVMEVRTATEYLTINSQGTVQPRTQSELIPEVSGRVVWISPSLVGGGSFLEGDVLLRIDQADYLSTLQRNEASLARAEVEHEFANDELKRLQKLHKQQLASQQQLDRKARQRNLKQAFSISRAPGEKHVALIDDVFTTGATCNQLAGLLLGCGVERVDAWCLARTAAQ